jgi:hypothetical protein
MLATDIRSTAELFEVDDVFSGGRSVTGASLRTAFVTAR